MVSGGTVVTGGIGAVLLFVGASMLRNKYRGRVKAERTANAESKSITELTPGGDRVSVSGAIESVDGEIDAAIADGAGPVVKTEAATYISGGNNDVERADMADLDRMTSSGGSFDYRQTAVQAVPFTVDDGTGTVHVEADESADIVVEPPAHVDIDGEVSLSEEVSSLVEEAGDDLIIGSQTDRLRQGVLKSGDQVMVQGVPQECNGGLSLGAGKVPMLLSDRSKSAAEEAQDAGGLGKYVIGTVLVLAGVGLIVAPFVVS